MITINAILEANKAASEAVENWLRGLEGYESEELVARGQILALAEEI